MAVELLGMLFVFDLYISFIHHKHPQNKLPVKKKNLAFFEYEN